MILLTPELRTRLRVNAVYSLAAEQAHDGEGDRAEVAIFDPVPVVKFFNPVGAATWLATELYDDEDTLFGLADLGFGCPELGCFSLSEIAALRLPFGLRIERDLDFASPHPLSVWAGTARVAGSIISAQAALADTPAPEIPTKGQEPDAG